MKKNLKFILGITFVGLLATLYFKPFSSTEIVVLDHLTFYNKDSIIVQICLVKNQPSSSKELKALIKEFNQKNKTKNSNFKRLFIKQHDYIFLPALILRENIDYSSKTTTRNDLDNIDFLGNASSLLNVDGKRIDLLTINIGEIWYYKK